MQHLLVTALLSLFSLVPSALAQSWWTVEWDATEFTSFSGDMIVPDLPAPGGTPYVWPGLQPGTTGVLQAVLDGRCAPFVYAFQVISVMTDNVSSSGTWWIGDG